MAPLDLILFGDLDGGIWGAALGAGAGVLLVGDGSGEPATLALPTAAWSEADDGWRLSGEGVGLHVAARAQAVSGSGSGEAGGPIGGSQELCRVQGTVTLGATEREIDCAGTRAVSAGGDRAALQSIRAVSGWTESDEAFALVSLRAPGARGHESDLVGAMLFDLDGWIAVDDPRLSTTYDGHGLPRRVNLELWIGDEEHELPRRAAGEVAGSGASGEIHGSGAAGEIGAARVQALPLRSHSRGHDGGGVYAMLTVA